MTSQSFTPDHRPREAIDFDPVPRGVNRHDGWTPARQREFIAVIAATGSTQAALQATGMSWTSAHALKRAPGAESFAAAWNAARALGVGLIREKLMDHSLNGIPDPVFFRGEQVGERRRFNHRSMMWLIEHGERAQGRAESDEERDRNEALAAKWVTDLLAALEQAEAQQWAQIGDDPDKRAAYELLNGPVDWDAVGPGAERASFPARP